MSRTDTLTRKLHVAIKEYFTESFERVNKELIPVLVDQSLPRCLEVVQSFESAYKSKLKDIMVSVDDSTQYPPLTANNLEVLTNSNIDMKEALLTQALEPTNYIPDNTGKDTKNKPSEHIDHNIPADVSNSDREHKDSMVATGIDFNSREWTTKFNFLVQSIHQSKSIKEFELIIAKPHRKDLKETVRIVNEHRDHLPTRQRQAMDSLVAQNRFRWSGDSTLGVLPTKERFSLSKKDTNPHAIKILNQVPGHNSNTNNKTHPVNTTANNENKSNSQVLASKNHVSPKKTVVEETRKPTAITSIATTTTIATLLHNNKNHDTNISQSEMNDSHYHDDHGQYNATTTTNTNTSSSVSEHIGVKPTQPQNTNIPSTKTVVTKSTKAALTTSIAAKSNQSPSKLTSNSNKHNHDSNHNNTENLNKATTNNSNNSSIQQSRPPGRTSKTSTSAGIINSTTTTNTSTVKRPKKCLTAEEDSVWWTYFALLIAYKEKHGDLEVPLHELSFDDEGNCFPLGNWFQRQREIHMSFEKCKKHMDKFEALMNLWADIKESQSEDSVNEDDDNKNISNNSSNNNSNNTSSSNKNDNNSNNSDNNISNEYNDHDRNDISTETKRKRPMEILPSDETTNHSQSQSQSCTQSQSHSLSQNLKGSAELNAFQAEAKPSVSSSTKFPVAKSQRKSLIDPINTAKEARQFYRTVSRKFVCPADHKFPDGDESSDDDAIEDDTDYQTQRTPMSSSVRSHLSSSDNDSTDGDHSSKRRRVQEIFDDDQDGEDEHSDNDIGIQLSKIKEEIL